MIEVRGIAGNPKKRANSTLLLEQALQGARLVDGLRQELEAIG